MSKCYAQKCPKHGPKILKKSYLNRYFRIAIARAPCICNTIQCLGHKMSSEKHIAPSL